MKLLGFNKVLCLSPHPDDVEYGMSGTIMKYQDTQFDVYCISHGTSTDSSSNEKRLDEVRNFWTELNLSNVRLLFSSYASFEDLSEAQWVTHIENNTLKENQYDALMGTSNKDSHFEHKLMNSFLPALSRSYPFTIIEYKSPSTLHDWTPNLFINIEETFTDKCMALNKTFLSQLDAPYFSKECLELFHQDYASYKKGVKYLEQFRVNMMYD
jgi:LmbE family N-acetylglucosaminyl deacetylase